MRSSSPLPAHRSFADTSGAILGSKLCTGATIRPNFFRFFLFICFLSFLFVNLSFLISSYSTLLILLSYLIPYYSSSSFSSLLIFFTVWCIPDVHINDLNIF
jgi:hypothetical protein